MVGARVMGTGTWCGPGRVPVVRVRASPFPRFTVLLSPVGSSRVQSMVVPVVVLVVVSMVVPVVVSVFAVLTLFSKASGFG